MHLGKMPLTLVVGYRALGEDYDTGSGVRHYGYDSVLHGPTPGATFRL